MKAPGRFLAERDPILAPVHEETARPSHVQSPALPFPLVLTQGEAMAPGAERPQAIPESASEAGPVPVPFRRGACP
jgi:hypothetical protein